MKQLVLCVLNQVKGFGLIRQSNPRLMKTKQLVLCMLNQATSFGLMRQSNPCLLKTKQLVQMRADPKPGHKITDVHHQPISNYKKCLSTRCMQPYSFVNQFTRQYPSQNKITTPCPSK